MKVIHVMDTLAVFGGVNSFVYDLCAALAAQGQNVILIGVLGKDKDNKTMKSLESAGVSVYCLEATSKKDAVLHSIPVLRKLIGQISLNEITICNLHLKLSVLIGGIATKGMKNVKCVETYHSRYSKYLAEQKAMSFCISKYICCSQSATEEFIQRFHPPKNKVACIPNGIDSDGLHKSIEGIIVESDSRIVFLSVGRFTYQKNFQVTTEAFSVISDQKAVYRLIGDGPLKETAVAAANGSNTICFLGSVPRAGVVRQLSIADMVVIPSLWEGLSIFMLEAMAMGCPLMLSDVESLRSVVGEPPLSEEETWRRCDWGYLVAVNNVQAYSLAALDYISNPNLKTSMSKEISLMADNYSIKTTARRYIEVYDQLIKEHYSDW